MPPKKKGGSTKPAFQLNETQVKKKLAASKTPAYALGNVVDYDAKQDTYTVELETTVGKARRSKKQAATTTEVWTAAQVAQGHKLWEMAEVQVAKAFVVDDSGTEEIYTGRLVDVRVDSSDFLFHVLYEDGDEEEYDAAELEEGKELYCQHFGTSNDSPKAKATATAKSKSHSKSNRRAMVTPSPTIVATSDNSDDVNDQQPPRKRGRSADTKGGGARKKQATVAKKQVSEEMDISDKESTESAVESPYFAKSKGRKASPARKATKDEQPDASKSGKAAASKKKAAKTETSDTAKKQSAAKKKAPAKGKKKADKSNEVLIVADDAGSESDGDDDAEDKPFKVEFAASGRATCRRCDETIPKGSVRVSHVPIFRGKPGYRVYRHLECAVFTENIVSVEQIGGWRRIQRKSSKDYERLVQRIQESQIEIIQEKEEIQPDELVQVNFEGEMRAPPKGLTGTLLPFQVEGVSWMHHQEMNAPEIRGGILADEMGMGKTLQTIATILDNRPILQHSKPGAKHPPSIKGDELEKRIAESQLWDQASVDWRHELKMNDVKPKMTPKNPVRAGTLVVCPVIALSQWKTEIEKFTEEDTLSIVIYHGPDRKKEHPVQKLCKYDIVLTTYQCIEQDFRKMVSPNKVTCPNCGGKFKIDKLRIHLKYFCGEGAQKTEAQARQERHRNGRGGPSGRGSGSSQGKGKDGGKKKEFPTTTVAKKAKGPSKQKTEKSAKKPAAMPKRKGKKAPGKKGKSKVMDNDSSSESEEETNEMISTPAPAQRPSRSAAVAASKRVASSVNEWSASKDVSYSVEDEESFGAESSSESDDDDESVMSYNEEDSDGEVIPSKKAPKNPAPKKSSRKRAPLPESSDDSDGSDDESDDAVLARARKKQAAAFKQAKNGKTTSKKPPLKGKVKKGKKKFDDESSSEEESDDDKVPSGDPLDDIDLDKLLSEAMEGSQMSTLHSMCWWRVVLDEAHMIKSRASQTAASAFALIGLHRWALSGTPLQNRVGELYSLIRFLRIDPMAFYFCRQKGCNCKSIHYRIKYGKCQDCGHRAFSHYAHFNRHVLNPIQRDGYSGDGRKAVLKLKNEVLDKAVLRRTKETRAEDLQLAPRIVSIRSIKLHPVELDFYNALYTETKSSFDDYVARGTVLNNFGHIFDLLSRMRQAVNHPYLIIYSKRNCETAAANSTGRPQVANGTTDCALCQELPTERVLSSCCGAAFCRSCVLEYMETALDGDNDANTPCPSCRDPFSIDLNQAASDVVDDSTLTLPTSKTSGPADDQGPSLRELPHVNSSSILRRINLAEFATSTKIEALVQELIEMRKTRPGSKALVFSQFVNMLDLIRWRLHCDPCLAEMGLGARILHGGMDVKSRDQCLKDFREDTNIRVLLMSLKAGGVALNLTVASEVFLVDNWWNPAAEMQAIDRTHRLGQHRCIRATRFIAEGTVEERVLQLQEKKRLVFDGTVGRDAGSLAKLTADDMVSLFT